jgi:hypothetical protein
MPTEKPLKERESEAILDELTVEREKQLNALLASGKTEEFLKVSELEENKKNRAIERMIEQKKALLQVEKLQKEIQRETWDWRFKKIMGGVLVIFGVYTFFFVNPHLGITLVTLGAGAFGIFSFQDKKTV